MVLATITTYFILKAPIFSGVLERMEGLWNGLSGNGAIDYSTYVRNRMALVGLEQFKETPILGMGMGNTHYLSQAEVGLDTYLHNNFVELLAGGGIIGFAIYYSIYIFLFKNFWCYRRYKDNEYGICLVMMIVLFLMDFGRVSYFSKIQYIYIMLFFLETLKLKCCANTYNGREITSDNKKSS